MISKTTIKLFGAYILCLVLLVTAAWAGARLVAKHIYPDIKAEVMSYKQHPGADCHTVKETCNRKKGCKCKLNCDPEGKRLPPAGGKAECPSFCCEEKCECHEMGCP